MAILPMAILKGEATSRPNKSNSRVWPPCRHSRVCCFFFFLPPQRSLNLSCRFVKHPLKFLSDGTSDNLLSRFEMSRPEGRASASKEPKLSPPLRCYCRSVPCDGILGRPLQQLLIVSFKKKCGFELSKRIK